MRTRFAVRVALSRADAADDGAHMREKVAPVGGTRLLVADVMTIDPVSINVDAPLEDAVQLMHSYSISGLPVVDDDGLLVGVISQTDLLADNLTPIGRLIRTRPSGLRVGEVMTSPAITVSLTDSLVEAARLMLDRRVHRLVAIDGAGRPVGVVSSIDYVALFAEG